MTPTCPHHNRELRPGKNGGYFCPTKNPDGNWCKYRPGKGETQAGAAASVAPAPVQAIGQQNTRYLLVVAALDFASRIHQGTGDAASALETARAALATFDAEMI